MVCTPPLWKFLQVQFILRWQMVQYLLQYSRANFYTKDSPISGTVRIKVVELIIKNGAIWKWLKLQFVLGGIQNCCAQPPSMSASCSIGHLNIILLHIFWTTFCCLDGQKVTPSYSIRGITRKKSLKICPGDGW